MDCFDPRRRGRRSDPAAPSRCGSLLPSASADARSPDDVIIAFRRPALVDNNFIFGSGAAGGIAEHDSNNATVVQNLVMNRNGSYPSSDLNGSYSAFDMGGTWRRHYNCRDMGGCPYHGATGGNQPWSWPSWGCGLAPTNATTNKNYYVAGNIFLGPSPITAECKYNNTDSHVCCNNTVDRNAVSVAPNTSATEHGANVPTVITLELGGDTDNRDWTFETQLTIKITADNGPSKASAARARGHGHGHDGEHAGMDVDFFGDPRVGQRVDAGPFQGIAGTTTELVLWPPR